MVNSNIPVLYSSTFIKNKGKIFKFVDRPGMIFDLKAVATSEKQKVELKVAEFKMLRFLLD